MLAKEKEGRGAEVVGAESADLPKERPDVAIAVGAVEATDPEVLALSSPILTATGST